MVSLNVPDSTVKVPLEAMITVEVPIYSHSNKYIYSVHTIAHTKCKVPLRLHFPQLNIYSPSTKYEGR